MKRTKETRSMENEKLLAQQVLSSDAYLKMNKHLMACYKPNFTAFICNLVDKWLYFQDRGDLCEDGSFFLRYENQTAHIGLSKHELMQCKKKAVELGVLKTEKRGIPAKEFYILDFHQIAELIRECLPQEVKNFNRKETEDLTAIKENKSNENKSNKYNKEKNNKKRKPDSIEEVRTYCKEKGLTIDPEQFFNHYEANGWVQGRGKPLKDWKAAANYWQTNEKKWGNQNKSSTTPTPNQNTTSSTQEEKEKIKDRLNYNFPQKQRYDHFNNQCYKKAVELFPNESKKQVGFAVLDLFEQIDAERSKVRKSLSSAGVLSYLFGPIDIVEEYIKWLKQDWVTEYYGTYRLNMLDINHSLFKNFRRSMQVKWNNTLHDTITGEETGVV